MPDPNLQQAIREAYASAPAGVVTLDTIEIRHASFTQPIRVVRNHPDTATWLTLGGSAVQAVLDGMTSDEVDLVGLVARLEDGAPENAGEMVAFIALAFDMELPPVKNTAMPEMMLTMDNVGMEISDALNEAATSETTIEATYRAFLSTDIEGPQNDPPLNLTLSEAEATPMQATARARISNMGNRAFPSKTYTAKSNPGLARG